MKDAAPPVQVGDIIDGKYRVERIVGSGGMGVVVAAEHLKLGRTVALKFLLKHACENHEAVTRFLREGQALASITSAHVARVMDVGTLEQGEPYLVMEYLDGADLGATLKQRGPLPVSEAVGYVLEVCEAVAEAHAKGIVHRDLKPSNLFLTQGADGVPLVKVLDFGISKAVVQQPDTGMPRGSDASTVPAAYVTSTGALVGSPLYMSPEQIRNARRVDERTDIWAIGVILYELVCGAPPFEGETLSGTLAAVSADPPRPMRSLREGVPGELEHAILRCLQKSPEQRFANIAELARALEPLAPAEARASVVRISRLLAARGGKEVTTTTLGPNADEAAPTVPSWEGNTAPRSTAGPAPRTRAVLAVALGAAVATGAWVLVGRSPEPAPALSASPTLDAATRTPDTPAARSVTSGAAAAPTLAPAPDLAAATPPATEVAQKRTTGAAPLTAPPPASAPAAPKPKPRESSRPPVTPHATATAHPQKPPDRDGTEDRK